MGRAPTGARGDGEVRPRSCLRSLAARPQLALTARPVAGQSDITVGALKTRHQVWVPVRCDALKEFSSQVGRSIGAVSCDPVQLGLGDPYQLYEVESAVNCVDPSHLGVGRGDVAGQDCFAFGSQWPTLAADELVGLKPAL